MALSDRYSRQIVFDGIGKEGQEKIGDSRVAIIGMGALGTVIANNLCRAGVGYLRLVDRDYVEISNLQRQSIYTEHDVQSNLPKAVAAIEYLQKINSEITLEPVVCDVNSGNIEQLIEGVDLVLDGTDNLETRFLINEACHKHSLPWIFGAAIMSLGMTMNIIPGKTPCFQCLSGDVGASGSEHTCATMGVLNMITGVAASVQSAEAVKMLLNSEEVSISLFFLDVWTNTAEYLEIKADPECPLCGRHHYSHLGKAPASSVTSLCGRNEIQVIPGREASMDFESLADNLGSLGNVNYNPFMLKFNDGKIGIKLFKDGRAIIENARDENQAKAIYTEYFGM
jgi:adenylyltransferase/sulfurtransferase